MTLRENNFSSYEGSGGNYLSNEIFYRIARKRELVGNTFLSGHFHVPGLTPKPENEFSSIFFNSIIKEQPEVLINTQQLIERLFI